jgi:hypothetical protein
MDWVAKAIADDSLTAVMDKSYIRQLYPNLCSAAFVMECKHGRGRSSKSRQRRLMHIEESY